MARPVPYVGMPVLVVHLGRMEASTVAAVCDQGRTVVVDGRAYTLRRLTGRYVADGEPYYGVRLSLGPNSATY